MWTEEKSRKPGSLMNGGTDGSEDQKSGTATYAALMREELDQLAPPSPESVREKHAQA